MRDRRSTRQLACPRVSARRWMTQSLVRARRAVAADPRFRCALSGAPLVDAVTLRDGRCAMEKAALVHGESYTVDATTRAAFEAAVADARAPVADFVPGASWRRQMPVAGLPPFGA